MTGSESLTSLFTVSFVWMGASAAGMIHVALTPMSGMRLHAKPFGTHATQKMKCSLHWGRRLVFIAIGAHLST